MARWWANSSFAARLAVVTAVGAAWRLTYLFAVKADDRLLLNDSIYYSIQAGLNSEGHWFEDALSGQPGAEHPPLTSLYLTPWSIGGGDSVVWQRFAITVLGIATVAVIGLVGRDIGRRLGSGAHGDRVGLVAAAIAVIYPNLWVNDSLVMSETPAMLLVALCLLAVLRWDRRPGWPIALLTGVLVGLAALTRSELALFVPAFALMALVQAHRRRTSWVPALVMVAAALVTLAPWTIYNARRFDQPVLLSTNDGNTLLGANCDRTYFDDVGGWDIRCLGPLADASGVVPDPSVRSQRRRDEAFDYIGDHLGRLPVVVAARLGRTADVYGLGSMVRMDVGEEKATWAVWAGIVLWWLLAALAVVGWLELARRRVMARWWLAVPVVTVVVTTVLFYGAHRIRAPAEPAVVVLAAVAVAVSSSPGGHAVRV